MANWQIDPLREMRRKAENQTRRGFRSVSGSYREQSLKAQPSISDWLLKHRPRELLQATKSMQIFSFPYLLPD
jgi:hypothetical protein